MKGKYSEIGQRAIYIELPMVMTERRRAWRECDCTDMARMDETATSGDKKGRHLRRRALSLDDQVRVS